MKDQVREKMWNFPEIDCTGYTLIVPAVAVGNIGQLAVDLLIYNGNMKRMGQILSLDFIPFLGADPYGQETQDPDICTATDFYCNIEKKIIALQIRSPPVNTLSKFFDDLRKFVEEKKIAKVIILTSKWQFVRNDDQLRSVPTRYLASPNLEQECGDQLQKLNWKKMEESEDSFRSENESRIYGGGFAMDCYTYLVDKGIPCAVLLKFCSEGNNSPDAKEFAHLLNQWIATVPPNSDGSVIWKEPPSWQDVFGPKPPSEIY